LTEGEDELDELVESKELAGCMVVVQAL